MSTADASLTITASQKTQIKAWWKKAKINNPNFQELQMSAVGNIKLSEIDNIIQLNNIDRGVFGISLLESVQYAHSRISYIHDKTGDICNGYIPIIIAKCGAFLKDQGFYYYHYVGLHL